MFLKFFAGTEFCENGHKLWKLQILILEKFNNVKVYIKIDKKINLFQRANLKEKSGKLSMKKLLKKNYKLQNYKGGNYKL